MHTTGSKIVLIDEEKCNGCGECVSSCEEGAIVIEGGKARLKAENLCDGLGACLGTCPLDAIRIVDKDKKVVSSESDSLLGNWPIQLKLLSPEAPFFKDADVIIAADCTAFAYGNLHQDILKKNVLIIGCPKLDDSLGYIEKLSRIFEKNSIKTITIVHMEVPCCFGLIRVVETAVANSKKSIPVKNVNISVKGKKL